ICRCPDLYWRKKIIEILSDHQLVKENKAIIQHFFEYESGNANFYTMLDYFHRTDLLDQNTFTLSYKDRSISGLLIQLDKAHITICKKDLKMLFSLSPTNIERLDSLMIGLTNHKLLNLETFQQALSRITFKLPSVEQSTIVKEPRKITLNTKIHFFMRASIDKEEGSFGIVKKGYATLDDYQAIYAIKTLKRSNANEAVREVKYHHLLGRQAFWYSHRGKARVLMEYQPEKSLDKFSKNEITAESFENRLRWIKSALEELNTLHQHYRIHGDIKPRNLIVNRKKASMKLIDFGGAHKKGSAKLFTWTDDYYDSPSSTGHSFYDDMNAMGKIVLEIFPELNRKSPTLHEQGIIYLMTAMTQPKHKLRCTSEDAMQFCQMLLDQFEQLNMDEVKKIKNATITRPETTVEDVLRDSARVSA
ncbi:MAG: protein kinase family protein, partial [Gammaproteobacteria bacterium]